MSEDTSISCTFESRIQTSYGEAIYVTGDLPALGQWNPRKALRLEYDTKAGWTKRFDLDTHVDFEYKFFVSTYDFREDYVRWTDGPNLKMTIHEKSSISSNSPNSTSQPSTGISAEIYEDKNFAEDHSRKKEVFEQSPSSLPLRMRVQYAMDYGFDKLSQPQDNEFYSLYFSAKLGSIVESYLIESSAKISALEIPTTKKTSDTQYLTGNTAEKKTQELCEQICELESFEELISLMSGLSKGSQESKFVQKVFRELAKRLVIDSLEGRDAPLVEKNVLCS